MPAQPQPDALVLFDGQCNLCSSTVQLLIPRDPSARLSFASLQSPLGQHIRERFAVPDEVDSVVVIAGGRALLYADAVIGIGLALGGWYRRGAQAARVIPRPLRDAGYRFLARHRYKWFGHHDACWMPTSELRSRFAADGLA